MLFRGGLRHLVCLALAETSANHLVIITGLLLVFPWRWTSRLARTRVLPTFVELIGIATAAAVASLAIGKVPTW